MILSSTSLLIDFGSNKSGDNWYVTNDGVMGGLSKGNAVLSENSILFSGDVSLKNNGGFTKIDSPYGTFDLSGYSSVTIRAKGEGHVAAFQLDRHQRFYLPSLKVMLEPTGEWKDYTFDLSDFKETQMGKWTGNTMNKEELSSIIRMGFIMSNKTDGAFKWEIDYINFDH